MKSLGLLCMAIIFVSTSCKNNEDDGVYKIEPPIERLDIPFTELEMNMERDTTFRLDNSTTITVQAGSLLDSLGNVLTGNQMLKYRQFDNAVTIFLAGMPMEFSNSSAQQALETAGMFEIRSVDRTVLVDPAKPISINIGTFFSDPRQGFFYLDEETATWELIDVPKARVNPAIDSLKQIIDSTKPEWIIPLPPNFYVFDYTRMADIFIGEENYSAIRKANLEALSNKMAGYGAKSLNIAAPRDYINYKGNRYNSGEMLWRAEREVVIPRWVYEMKVGYYDIEEKKYIDQITVAKQSGNKYLFVLNDIKKNLKFSFNLEAVTHLRYLLKYTPEQLISKQNEIAQEIEETEKKIRKTRVLDFTVQVYSMGIFNVDRPVKYGEFNPILELTLDGEVVKKENVKKVAVFNSNLSSVAYQRSIDPLRCPFYEKGSRMVLVTKDGQIGLLNSKQFNEMLEGTDALTEILNVPLIGIDVESEADLMEQLSK